ncbi:hypothetical protein PR202_gb26627 [Eleusine coracana subsp. coracana]|uniref:Threonyl/alanyl tRNA synthetase SAD domain-containing protein n=1 Tax=Eleusine coracana subsp. coracana TaxID=191504 RepID=A0AAV5FT19_ELECO|nr:hypothetical protein PR202_gb26627 [Eleusine coracana subsp. coracana]
MATAAAPARAVGPTRLAYFDDMWALRSHATVLDVHQEESGRQAVVLDATVFHPQGGGQPADKGIISAGGARFLVEDVRTKDGVVYHYGRFEGHLLDICTNNVGLSHLEPGKCYHFPDGAFVEYKGVIPPDQIQDKQNELEREANKLILEGAKVLVSVFPYEEAAKLCGGSLPSYISKDSTPRVVRFGDYPGCPCGGTHVADISVINNLKVTNIRVKKGLTKVSYSISP